MVGGFGASNSLLTKLGDVLPRKSINAVWAKSFPHVVVETVMRVRSSVTPYSISTMSSGIVRRLSNVVSVTMTAAYLESA